MTNLEAKLGQFKELIAEAMAEGAAEERKAIRKDLELLLGSCSGTDEAIVGLNLALEAIEKRVKPCR